jgi:hypothetical protein
LSLFQAEILHDNIGKAVKAWKKGASPKNLESSRLMPLTPQLRQDIDDIRNYLFGGGYPDPVANAEQLGFFVLLLPCRRPRHATAQARARLSRQADRYERL